jgi:Zn-dependent protease with chaperone function
VLMRSTIAGVLLCAFMAGSAWLVQRRGQAYRESLAMAGRAHAVAGDSAARQDSGVASSRPASADSKPAVRPNALAQPARTAEASPPTQRAGQTASPPTPVAAAVPAVPARQGTSPGPPPSVPALSRPADKSVATVMLRWKNDPFWNRPELVKPWPLDNLTSQDEQQLGEQLNSLILTLNPSDSGSGLRRVKEAAEPMLDRLALKGAEYQFFVLDSEVPNVFSHPGRYVYVSRKLLELIPEEEPNVLEFALGHEIAHVEFRHAVNCLKSKDVRKFADGTLPKLYFLIIPFGYPNNLELAADTWVYRQMQRLGRSEHDRLKFLRILDRYAKAHRFEDGRGKPQDLVSDERAGLEMASGFSPVENHLRSHPAAYDRIRQLKHLTK